MLRLDVTNRTGDTVERGGFIFTPFSTIRISTHEASYRHLRACSYLKVAVVEDEVVEEAVPVNEEEATGAAEEQGELLESSEATESQEEAKEEATEGHPFDCPYCDKYGGANKTKAGLTAHVRNSHPDMFEEFRQR